MDRVAKLWKEKNELLGEKFDRRGTYFNNRLIKIVNKANMAAEALGHKEEYLLKDKTELEIVNVGDAMEIDTIMLKRINDEIKESKEILQNLVNDIRAMQDIVQPELLKTIKEIRSSRMALTGELQKSLKDLRDVRKFFLESEYQIEMDRLQRFLDLAKQLKGLIDDGTMDAICDVILKLAVAEKKEV